MNRERTLSGFFAATVGRPVTMTVLFATLVVVGWIAYARIPIQLFPSEFTEPRVNVWIPNPGASARENEEKVARPIEEQLRTLSGIRETVSRSREDSVYFSITFENSVDMDLARAEVRDRIERAWPNLPATAETPGMWTESADSMPIAFFGISVRGDPDRRGFLMEKYVVPRLEAVDGIGKIDVWGVLNDSVRILLDEDKVAAAQVDVGRIIARLSADNFAMPMGEINDGGREIILRSDMRFRSVEDVANFPVGNGLKLRDLGRVTKVKSVGNMLTLIDGQHAYYGMATKDSQSNVVATSRNLRRAIEEIENDPAVHGDVSVTLFFVQGDFIEGALAQLGETAMWGGVLAAVVLFAFLRRLRLTLCVALSIPASALVAIIWTYFTGGSFNILTMVGVTLVIGMLVDNSVVVIENIVRIHAKGHPPLRAAVLGARQIALAVTLATLTTVVVFLPLIFMTENKQLRVMFGGMGLPLSVSLVASLAVALLFLPVVAARLLGHRDAPPSRLGRMAERILGVPVRILAWGVGGLRLGFHGARTALFHANRLLLRVLVPLRWAVALAALVATGLAWTRLSEGFAAADLLADLGVDVSGSARGLQTTALLCGGGLTLLALLGFSRWARRPARPPARPATFVPPGRSLVEMLVRQNHQLVEWTLRHRFAAAGLAALAGLSVVIPKSAMEVTAFGQDATDDSVGFRVAFEAPFTLSEAEDQVRLYGDVLERLRPEFAFEHWSVRFDENGGYFSLFFDDRRPEAELKAVEERLREALPRVPGHRLRFYQENDSEGRSQSVVRFLLRGPDSRELERLGVEAQRILEGVQGLSEVSTPLENAPDVIEVRVDRDLAHELGVTSEAVQTSVSWSLRGWPLPRYQERGRDIPLLIELDQEQTAGYETLRDLSVWNENAVVPLATFSDFHFTKGSRGIWRRNGETTFTIEARVDDPLQVIPVTERAYAALGALELPRGFSWDRSESAFQRTQKEFQELFYALILAIFLVFLLMAILFESLLLPLSVLFTIPFAIVGAWWGLLLFGTAMDSFGYIGMVILSGVVVNNGIVLIDRIHRLRAGMDRAQAVIAGCGQRVRPILMTALTTVCGLLPMIFMEPPPGSLVDYRALATIVAGGLIASTFFTLWVVPLAYTLLDDLAAAFGDSIGWFLDRLRSGRSERPGRGSAGIPALRR